MPYVYVITNPAMPGLVKIGKTDRDDVGRRIAELNTTEVPLPFELHFACRVDEAGRVENALHTAFGPHRLNPKREFFKIEPLQAIAILKLLHIDDTTFEATRELSLATPPEERQAASAYKARRPKMNFQEMGIVVGSVITNKEADETASVLGPRKVLFRGQEVSLTEATRMVRGLPPGYAIQPSPFWSFDGVTLSDLYEDVHGAEE